MDNSLKDKVLAAVDIVALVGERVGLIRRGKEYVGLCPFHPDHKPSLSVSPQKQIFKCWSCGVGGDVIRFVQQYDRVDFREALAALARRAGIDVRSSPADREARRLRDEILAAVSWAGQHFRRNLEATAGGRRARQYALDRGLTPETIERHGLGFAAATWDDLLASAARTGLRAEVLQQAGLIATNDKGRTYDRFRNRLIFPIADALGRPIAFGGRALDDDPAKYLNSPETVLFSKSRVLYGLDSARRAIEDQAAAIVVEGYMDAVLLHQYGFPNVVATLGTALTDAHVKLLRPLSEKIYLCFDADQAGVRAADRAVEVALGGQVEVRVVVLKGGQDPADCVLTSGAAGFQSSLNQTVDALEFKWSQTLSTFDQGGRQARRAAIEEYLRFVAHATLSGGVDPLQQTLLADRLSGLLGVPTEAVFDLLASARRSIRQEPDSDKAESEGDSAYEARIRGLPSGLVTTFETVLGLLLIDANCWRWVDDTVAAAAAHSETWQRLYGVLLELREEVGEYSTGQVVERCDDSAVCELVGRVRSRVAGVAPAMEAFHAAQERLGSELRVLRMGGLREDLHQAAAQGADDDEAFRALRNLARGRHAILPAERGGSMISSAGGPARPENEAGGTG